MASARTVTVVAAVVGAGVGGLVAFWQGGTAEEPSPKGPPPLPAPPAMSSAGSTRADAAPPPPVVLADKPAASATVVTEANERELAIACARGDAPVCLTMAEAHFTGKGLANDHQKAVGYRSRAVGLYTDRCREHEAGACLALADLFESGRAGQKDPDRASGLRERARTLCARSPKQAGCERVSEGDKR